jgi:hypothetical protein
MVVPAVYMMGGISRPAILSARVSVDNPHFLSGLYRMVVLAQGLRVVVIQSLPTILHANDVIYFPCWFYLLFCCTYPAKGLF